MLRGCSYPMEIDFDPYEVLGISRNASLEEIRSAYRSKAGKYHPDTGGDAWAFRRLNEAYEFLRQESQATDGATGDQIADPSAGLFKKSSNQSARQIGDF